MRSRGMWGWCLVCCGKIQYKGKYNWKFICNILSILREGDWRTGANSPCAGRLPVLLKNTKQFTLTAQHQELHTSMHWTSLQHCLSE